MSLFMKDWQPFSSLHWANPLPGESDREKRRSALAVGWFLLLQRKLRMAEQHFKSAAKQWPRDAAIQLAYGTVIETECAGPYPVLTAELLVPPQPPPRSRIERFEVNPYRRERSARVSMLRDAERVLELAAQLDASSIEARIRLAHVRALEHKDADAVALLDDVLRGTLPNKWKYIANLIRGTVYEHSEKRENAKAAYEQALQLRPGSQIASIALSHLAYTVDDREAAAAALDRLFEGSRKQLDPWWDYPLGLRTTADALFDKLRSQLTE
jgi:tetratricopeptide (TPR) repeat protein